MRGAKYVTLLLAMPVLFPISYASAATHPASAVQASAQADHSIPNVEFRIKADAEHSDVKQSPRLAPQARAAVVMDAATGKVLFEKDAHEKMPLASVTKVMTLLLVMEAIDSGKLHLTDQIKVSEHAASMGGSQIFLEPGETMTVQDMLKGIAMASANDACVAIAEHLSGTEEEFVQKMNERAQELGMDDTRFVNCNGLPVEGHYSSAHDIATMSRELLKHTEITKYTSAYSDYLRKDTDHPFWLVNTNKLVRFYPGLDGLKTGFTAEAKYCLSATAKRDGFRVITVVMGEPKPTVRNQEVAQLFNWSFAEYQSKVLYPAGATVKELEVKHGIPDRVSIQTGDTLGLVEHRGEKFNYQTEIKVQKLAAPLKKGQVVGQLSISKDGEQVAAVPLVVASNVRKAGFFAGFGRTVKKLVTFGEGE